MTSKPNEFVTSYLDYYLNAENSLNFAVLITGPWGVGKTYLVTDYFAKRKFEHPEAGESNGDLEANEYLLVSLFGVSSAEEFRTALLAAAYPHLAGKTAKLVGGIAKTLFGAKGLSTDLSISDFVELPKDKVFVFDDLERCGMRLSDALGMINVFVEQDLRKVIIIANEEEIPRDQKKEFREKKEKVIGQSLRVIPETNAALTHFLETLPNDDSGKYVRENLKSILDVYHQSKTQNLRILRHALWDLRKLVESLDSQVLNNEEGMIFLTEFFLAYCFAFRSGRISSDDLINRRSAYAVYLGTRNEDQSKQIDPISEEDEKYSGIDLRDETLSNSLLTQIFADGFFNPTELKAALLSSSHFSDPEQEPSWVTVWYGPMREDDAFEKAAHDMEQRYHRNEYTTPGILLHVFMLRVWLSDLGYIEESKAAVIDNAKARMQSLVETRKLEDQDGYSLKTIERDSWGGLGFHNKETEEFATLSQLVNQAIYDDHEHKIELLSGELLQLLKDDAQGFRKRVSWVNGASEQFISASVLKHLNVGVFLDVTLSKSVDDQHTIFRSLKERYDHGKLQSNHPEEYSWYETVRQELQKRTQTLTRISAHRLETYDRWFFAPILNSGQPEVSATE